MNTVAAPDAQRVLVLQRAGLQRGQHPVQPGQQQVAGAAQLDVQRGVQNIGTGHALMHKARLIRADMFGQMGQKGDHVMLGDRLDLINPRHVKGHVLCPPHRFGIRFRDHAKGSLGIAGMGLDLEPDAEPGLG